MKNFSTNFDFEIKKTNKEWMNEMLWTPNSSVSMSMPKVLNILDYNGAWNFLQKEHHIAYVIGKIYAERGGQRKVTSY